MKELQVASCGLPDASSFSEAVALDAHVTLCLLCSCYACSGVQTEIRLEMSSCS